MIAESRKELQVSWLVTLHQILGGWSYCDRKPAPSALSPSPRVKIPEPRLQPAGRASLQAETIACAILYLFHTGYYS
jgi:hypothetical protein